jgi:hypothetical protein
MKLPLRDHKTYIKVKLSLGLFKNYAIKMYGREEVQPHVFLTFKLDGGERSALLPGKQRQPTMDWKHKHQSLSPHCGKDQNPCPHQQSNSICLVIDPVAQSL